MRKLHPQLDDKGILRVGGRLENALIKYEAKHPVILPYRHQVTDLIISEHHQKTGHLGQEYALSSLRQLYWIIKGRSAVRRVISSCFPCKRRGAVRGEQLMADLPKERLMSGDPPFTYVGVDHFGPLYVRQGRSNVKRYGCLFTCLVTRAVHIEVVHSLDTDSFINAVRQSKRKSVDHLQRQWNKFPCRREGATRVIERLESAINPKVPSSEKHQMEV